MIDGFHSYYDVHQLGIVVVDVFDQFCLCIGWSCDENRAGVCNRFSSCVKIVVILRGMPAPDRIRLVMDVPGWMVRVQD
jgi:hypothetical protein